MIAQIEKKKLLQINLNSVFLIESFSDDADDFTDSMSW